MADSSSPPATVPKKKKKALAFLESSHKPAPAALSSDGAGSSEKKRDDEGDDDLAMFKRSKHFFPRIIEEQDELRQTTTEKKNTGPINPQSADEKSEGLDQDQGVFSRTPKRRRLSSPRAEPQVPAFESHDELYGPATPPRRGSRSPANLRSGSTSKRARSLLDRERERSSVPVSKKDEMEVDESGPFRSAEPDALPSPKSPTPHEPRPIIDIDDHDGDTFLDAPPLLSDDGIEDKSKAPDAISAMRASASPSPERKDDIKPAAIVLDDSDDDELGQDAAATAEDPYAHFFKRAVERDAAAKAAAAALIPSKEGHHASRDNDLSWSALQEPKVKPVVKIFVVSRLSDEEDPGQFGSKRRLDQDLGVVRKTYCSWLRQQNFQFCDDLERDIFLTWRGHRIYDFASGASLGWQPDKFHESRHLTGFKNGGIVLEAWTEERFTAFQLEQERQRMLDRGELDEDDLDAKAGNERDAPKVRITLKERGKEPVKLTAWMDLSVKHLIGAYRKQQNVPTNHSIRLRNEGEWLEPDALIEDADIEDMSIIEVYINAGGA